MNCKNIPKYYFFIEDDVIYDDGIAYLAEGLSKLGYSFYGSRNFWYEEKTKEPLIKKADINQEKWDIIFLTHTAFRLDYIDAEKKYNIRTKKQNTKFLKANCRKLVLINSLDGVSYLQEDNPDIDIIFRSHYNINFEHCKKTLPYILGGYQERLRTINPLGFQQKKSTCLDTFGFSHPFDHQQRKIFRKEIKPRLEKEGIHVESKKIGSLIEPPNDETAKKWWILTGGKHNPEYYKKVGSHFAHACFCGTEIGGLPKKPNIFFVGGRKAEFQKRILLFLSCVFGYKKRLVQWDSWRFWETLAMQSVPLMFELENFGVKLPVMPQNFVHYIGLNPQNLNESIKKLKKIWPEIPEMAKDSFSWLKNNYSAEKNAARVLEEIKKI